MKNTFVTVAVLGLLLGAAYAVYSHMAAPTEYTKAPEEPEMCLVDTMKYDEPYNMFFDKNSGKAYLEVKSNGDIDIHEDALPDRSNCIE